MTIIKSSQEVATMRKAGKIVAAVLQKLKEEIRSGIQTKQLDTIATEELKRHGARASFKGYRGFPASLCVSVNDEVVHGIPSARKLKDGDIVSLDFGAIVNGFHGDAAITVPVGTVSPEAQKLIDVTENALMAGIKVAHDGSRLGDVSAAIQDYAESRGFSVVREYSGHGIGRSLHEDPLIPNFGIRGEGPVINKGMTMALEPMVNIGGWQTRVADNNWTVLTRDGNLSAHFEHTIAISDNGPEVLTQL
jgi:methionyl aminopeptidase